MTAHAELKPALDRLEAIVESARADEAYRPEHQQSRMFRVEDVAALLAELKVTKVVALAHELGVCRPTPRPTS